MQKTIQAKPGNTATPEVLKGDARAKSAALKGLDALSNIDELLAQEVEKPEPRRRESSCGCGW